MLSKHCAIRFAFTPLIVSSVLVASLFDKVLATEQSGSYPVLDLEPEGGLKLIIAMLVFACLVAFYFLKRANLVGFRANAKGDITIENQHFITAKERVVVMNVEGERFLLGVTSAQVNLISKLGVNSVMQEDSEAQPAVSAISDQDRPGRDKSDRDRSDKFKSDRYKKSGVTPVSNTASSSVD